MLLKINSPCTCGSTPGILFHFTGLFQRPASFLCKGQRINMLGCAGRMTSAATTQLCQWSWEQPAGVGSRSEYEPLKSHCACNPVKCDSHMHTGLCSSHLVHYLALPTTMPVTGLLFDWLPLTHCLIVSTRRSTLAPNWQTIGKNKHRKNLIGGVL